MNLDTRRLFGRAAAEVPVVVAGVALISSREGAIHEAVHVGD